jgi:methyl coenzyme M reductase beta subunit
VKKIERSKKLLLQKIENALQNGIISEKEAAMLKKKMREIELQSIDNLANKIKSIDFEE